LQSGRLVQDLLPIAGEDDEKNDNNSRSTLDLHTEEACHPNQCDYLRLRFDDYFTHPLPNDREATEALSALTNSLAATEQALTLAPGDCVFIGNHLAAHGRRPFTPRYDGTDRESSA